MRSKSFVSIVGKLSLLTSIVILSACSTGTSTGMRPFINQGLLESLATDAMGSQTTESYTPARFPSSFAYPGTQPIAGFGY